MRSPRFTIRRKDPPPVEPFECAICERTVPEAGQHWWLDSGHQPQTPPICRRCEQQWGQGSRLYTIPVRGAARPDNMLLLRLRAITTALEWEIKNGRYRAARRPHAAR